jgi:predicted TIM-barrel fold metal-dependent hydrolase
VILGHSGLAPQIDQAIACARKYSNAYLEISGNPYSYMFEKAVKMSEIGVERILYGSDLPSLHPRTEIFKVLTLNISEADKSMILSQNLENLLNRK